MTALPAQRTFFRGSDGYEAARRKTVWNSILPQRFPDVIVQASDTADVVATIRYARAHGHRVGIRSGGHSWAASHLRDGGVLLDVSRLEQCDVDTDRMVARVGPCKIASVFANELDAQGLFFPAGHCEGIRLGGYLLQGGYGWNSKVLGPACESVLGLQVVTADGDTLYCDPQQHADLYWAARGSGPGFFGVVTSFTLRLHPRADVLGTCLYMYPVEVADEVVRQEPTLYDGWTEGHPWAEVSATRARTCTCSVKSRERSRPRPERIRSWASASHAATASTCRGRATL